MPELHGTEVAELHPQLVWQRVSPTTEKPDGPVLYQIQLTLGQPNTVPKYDNSGRHFTASQILDNGTTVAIGGFSVNGATGIVTFASGQSFPASGFPAPGGDASGTLSSLKVVGLQGVAISSTLPSSGQVLSFNGTNWAPATPTGGGTVASVMAGTGLAASPANPIVASGTLSLDTTFTDNRYAAFSGNTNYIQNLSGGTQSNASFNVSGNGTVGGTFSLPATGTATSGAGFNSANTDWSASAFSSTAIAAQKETFRWMAEPVGNNTASPSAKFDLLFGSNGAVPVETGFSIASNGQMSFASGQLFPGALPLTGGTMTGNISFAGTQTFSGTTLTGLVPISNGGTGIGTGPTLTPNPIVPAEFLRGSGPGIWSVSAIQASDVPGLPYLSLAGGHVTGGLTVDGNVTLKSNLFLNTSSLLELPGGATFSSPQASSSGGTDSSQQEFDAAAWNTSVPGSETERFVWQAEPVNDITTNPSGKLSLLFGSTRPTPLAETGLSLGSNGQIAFAAGQKAPAVANQKFMAKSAAIGTTTLLTVGPVDGVFRISIYAVTTTADTGGGAPNIIPSLSWTDDSGPQTMIFNGNSLDLTNVGKLSQITFVLQGKANQPVNFSTSGTITNGQYSFYITAEQIM